MIDAQSAFDSLFFFMSHLWLSAPSSRNPLLSKMLSRHAIVDSGIISGLELQEPMRQEEFNVALKSDKRAGKLLAKGLF